MIGRLTGVLLECRPDHVLLDVAGVGYELEIPLSTYYALAAGDGRPRTLHVHTHVREDALQLFGFGTGEEKRTFEMLIGIRGVGPRLALAFLSGIGVEELRQAVLREDRARLEKIPGVGRKTAERVLLELRDRLSGPGRGRRGAAATLAVEPAQAPTAPQLDLREDALSALVNLGYTRDAAGRAVDRVLGGSRPERWTLEFLLRSALGELAS
jgi:holliday junction DNA helicase RuvA